MKEKGRQEGVEIMLKFKTADMDCVCKSSVLPCERKGAARMKHIFMA